MDEAREGSVTVFEHFLGLIDALRWFKAQQQLGLAQMTVQTPQQLRYRLDDACSRERFHIAFDADGETCLYYLDVPTFRWVGALPWSAIYVNDDKTLMGLACPPLQTDQLSQDQARFKTEISQPYLCVDIHCTPLLFSCVIADSIRLAPFSVVNGVVSPGAWVREIPVKV